MIYDGHAYCLPELHGAGGFENPADFRRHLQLATAGMGHSLPPWRASDRAPADTSGLADLSKGWGFSALKDADFRPGTHGRFEWTVDGVDYVKQLMPPGIAAMSYPAENLVADLDYAGIDRALLHRTPYLGVGNDFVAECARQFPDRIQALAHVEEWLIADDVSAAVDKVDHSLGELGLSGLQFLPMFLDLQGDGGDWAGLAFTPFWDAVTNYGVPVFFTLGPRGGGGLDGYVAELQALRRWCERYPDVSVVLTHGFSWRNFRDGELMSLPEALLDAAPLDRPNVYLQLVLSVTLGARWAYPMPQFRDTLGALVDRFGVETPMWGSDHPFETLHYTYRQCVDQIRGYADILGDDGVDATIGGNMARLMSEVQQ
jgi:predicted TIM-barrel fold metal-dependent hydrolase